MKFLIGLFLAMALYGFVAGKHGPALISLVMAGFTYYGGRKLDQRDREWANNPRNAPTIPDTLELLDQHAQEGSVDRI